jgi:hypothetical protein
MSMSEVDRFSIRTLVPESGAGSPLPEPPAQAAVASNREMAEA